MIDFISLYKKIAAKNRVLHKLSYKPIRYISQHYSARNIRYQSWIKSYDRVNLADKNFYHNAIEAFHHQPRISVIMPVHNPKVKFLRQAIESVKSQFYPYWELCIADDASTNPRVNDLLNLFADQDERIKLVFRKENGGISAASNSAFSLASGDFIALLDHDDLLHPLALYFVAAAINKKPQAEIIYSDEDKITSRGKRIEPYFKSEFDYDLFLSQNMISHLGVYRTKTVHEIDGFKKGLEGSQDHDLALRIIKKITPDKIQHIPHVLYHWRISKKSTANSVDSKPYAMISGVNAIIGHLKSRNIQADVKPIYDVPGYRVQYAISETSPTVTLIELSENFSEDVIINIDHLTNQTNYNYFEVICLNDDLISDKASTITKNRNEDQQFAIVSDRPRRKREKSNLVDVISNLSSKIICFITEDFSKITENWLEELIGIINQKEIGAISPKVLFNNSYIYSSGIVFFEGNYGRHIFHGLPKSGRNNYFGWASLNKGYSALPAGCLLVKRDHFLCVGGFNQSLSNHQTQVIDLCLKLKEKGLRNVMVPDVEVTLDLSKNDYDYPIHGDIIKDPDDRDYFTRRWKTFLERDPAFNPNLTLHKGKPTVSDYPRMTQYDRPA